MSETKTISLGGKSWPLRPLTFDQIEAIDAMMQNNLNPARRSLLAIEIALGRDHQADVKSIRGLEGTVADLGTAFRTILEMAGFVESKQPGEEQAAG